MGLHAGIGGVTALKLIQKHETLERVLESMRESKYQIPDPFPFEEARRLFKGARCFLQLLRFLHAVLVTTNGSAMQSQTS